MIKHILAVLAGLVVAIITFIVFEWLNHSIFPPAENSNGIIFFSLQNMMLVIIGWAIGSFLAGVVIKKISNSDSYILPITAGGILTLSGIANLILVKHPLWMQIITVIIFIPFVWLGYSMLKPTKK